MQISIQQRLTGLPEFRLHIINNAHAEGRAVYAEALGKEIGFFWAGPGITSIRIGPVGRLSGVSREFSFYNPEPKFGADSLKNLLAQRNCAECLQLPVLDRGRSFMRLAAGVSAAVA